MRIFVKMACIIGLLIILTGCYHYYHPDDYYYHRSYLYFDLPQIDFVYSDRHFSFYGSSFPYGYYYFNYPRYPIYPYNPRYYFYPRYRFH
jgi:hypothetical protein